MRRLLVAAVLLLCSSSPLASQEINREATIRAVTLEERGPFLYWSFSFDQVMGSKNFNDVLYDALGDPVARQVLAQAGALIGIPAEWTQATLTVAAEFRSARDQEGQTYWLAYPSGYAFCAATVVPVSWVPNSGPRASTLLAEFHPDRITAEAWTQRMRLGEGRAWMEARFSVVLVAEWAAETMRRNGVCREPPGHVFHCRGDGSGGDLPACTTWSSEPPARED